MTPVAVIGMACRLPGGIDSPQQLWDALLDGQDFVTEIPDDRWDVEAFYDPEPGVPGRSVTRWGSFLDDVGGFDSDFFGMTEREATAIDPQHRLLLETSWEAIEFAGIDPTSLSGSRTGVFVGLTHSDYELLSADCGAAEGPYGFTGTSNSFASGRISYALGLHGPAVTVDTACSSGLVAVHQACRSLHEGESDMAVAGGVSVTLEPRKSVSGSLQGMLSPSGRCHAFDVAADGFVSGEGCVVLLFKRLADAERDGDRILAVIRGTAANQDGHTVNIATPSEEAQVDVYRDALAAAGVDPSTVGLVEAHGTGTPVGDPIEYRSLATVYGTDEACALASVKTNFGHCQSASGTLGLVKAVLALEHGVVPRNLHFHQLPDQLTTVDTKLFVPQENTAWPGGRSGPRRAAVSSYGMSGTNAHAVVEQAAPSPAAVTEAAASGEPMLFPVSATSAEQLRVTAGRLADWVESAEGASADGSGVPLGDLAYTLARRRSHRPVRAAVTGSTGKELVAALREVADGELPHQPVVGRGDRGPVWVFSGQGSQWARMGADLLATEPVFAKVIAEIEPIIARESGFSVTDAMTAAETVTGIDRVQPTIFAMQVAMAETLKSYGVRPGAVIGHSLGESAAAVVAGALSIEDGLKVICRRSRLMKRISGSGAMAAVELPGPQVLSELSVRGVKNVVLSVVASPTSTVVGGDTETVRELVKAWEANGVLAREVAVDVASHSPQVEPILEDLLVELADIEPRDPEVPYYSSTLWDARDRPSFTAEYWSENLRYTVRFAAAVQAALNDGFRVFGELAPHPLLTHAVDSNAASLDMPVAALAAMRREQELPLGLKGFVADLHCAGAVVDFATMYPEGNLVDAPLSTWNHRELMLSRDDSGQPTHGGSVLAVHPLLGAHVHLDEEPVRDVWQGDAGTTAHPWLSDHAIHNTAVLPGAAYCEMALSAAAAAFGPGSEVRDIQFGATLMLDESTPIAASVTLDAPGAGTFVVETTDEGERIRRATAQVFSAPPADSASETDSANEAPRRDLADLKAAHTVRTEGDDLRAVFEGLGLHYGPAFSGLSAVYLAADGGKTLLAEVALPSSIRAQQSQYGVHPALLDVCFQAVAVHPDVRDAGSDGLLLPVGVQRMQLHGPVRKPHYCLARVTATRKGECDSDIEILDESGLVLLTVEGMRLAAGASASEQEDRLLNQRLLTIEWEKRELPQPATPSTGSWLVLSAAEGAEPLARELTEKLNDAAAEADSEAKSRHERLGEAGALRALLDAPGLGAGFTGVLVVTEPAALAVSSSTHPGSLVGGRDRVAQLVTVARELAELPGEPPRLVLVTRGAAAVLPGDRPNLADGGLRGLLRVIDSEYPHLNSTWIDVDGTGVEAARVAEQLRSGSDEDETAWRGDTWYTARLLPGPMRAEDRRTTVVDQASSAVRLEIRNPGDVESLEFAAFTRVPPGPGEIEVSVVASSVNFADVLVAFGRYPTFDGYKQQLGIDFSGVVTAVGPDVTGHRVGDHVAGMSPNGCWATFVICDARHAVTLPAGLPVAEAAAIPAVAATAWYALHDLARITSRDKVLIHSGTGGVGQAAIAIARAAGCEIFATAGSPGRRKILQDMGITHVYDSRSLDFAAQIRRDTDGYGVDVVLNSLPGAAQRAGLELLAFGGRFVEIGKRDIYGDTRLGLFPFRRNLSLYAVDLALLSHSHPEIVQRLLATVCQQTADGALPLPPTTHFPVSEAPAAVRLVGGAGHTGKVLLDMAHSGQTTAVLPPAQVPVFRPDGSYIITGGLGGLGLFLAGEMAAAGCGRIVVNSRSAPTAEASEALEALRAKGADIAVVSGDVADLATAESLVAVATETGLPVRGVLHGAAVVEDATLTNVTDELIDRCWAPKVYGAWNLHQATSGQDLDWFCMFSSAAALVGAPGQGAYAAANSWLDAFARWRHAQGLPATAIGWGAWGQVGRGTTLAEEAGVAIDPAEGSRAFATLLRYDRPYSGYAPILGTPWLTAFAERSTFAQAFQSGQAQNDSGKFLAELRDVPQEEWPGMIRRLVSDQMSLLLRRSIDPDRPLSEYGLDSLGNLELRTRIETQTGVRIGPTQITTVRGLADHLCQELQQRQGVPAAAG